MNKIVVKVNVFHKLSNLWNFLTVKTIQVNSLFLAFAPVVNW